MQNTSQRRTHRPDTVEDHEYQQVEVIKNHEKLIKKIRRNMQSGHQLIHISTVRMTPMMTWIQHSIVLQL